MGAFQRIRKTSICARTRQSPRRHTDIRLRAQHRRSSRSFRYPRRCHDAQEYLHRLSNTSLQAINQIGKSVGTPSFSSVIAPAVEESIPSDDQALSKTYIGTLNDWIYEDVAPRTNHRLFRNDLYGRSYAALMLGSVRIDFGILGSFIVPGMGPLTREA
jgi:hypothetical protein